MFLRDRQARGLAAGSLKFYRQKLTLLLDYCNRNGLQAVGDVSADTLRAWLLELAAHHNPGGLHAAYRTTRALFRWFEAEFEPDGWRNPIDRVKAPKVPVELLEPADDAAIRAMLKTCSLATLTGARDGALLLFLLDSGCRAAELLALNRGDYDPFTGKGAIRQGKGGKGRVVFIGRKTRRAMRQYLNQRQDNAPALWVTVGGGRLTYDGLRSIITRRARAAGVKPPALHGFRRLFALECLRGGMDVRTLQAIMGHSSLTMLIRYTKLTADDLQTAHDQAGPVDRLDW